MANANQSRWEKAGRAIRETLARMRADARGNVLPIVAAVIIPIVCLIGSGIDLARAYAAQARLQVACDAASLAGRRAMTNGTVDDTVRAESAKFFNFNFPQRTFGTAAFTPTTTQGVNSSVVVSASTTLPTSIMKIFGFRTLPLSVTCNARQDFVNTDIVLVLDTTGSMADRPIDPATGKEATTGPTKIEALRSAVLALYDELAPVQTQLTAAGLKLRYGVVPYSSNVNVGKLVKAVNSSYIASDTWDYQSRISRDVETTSTSTSTQNGACPAAQSRTPATGYPATSTTTSYNNGSKKCTITTTTYSLTPTWYYEKVTQDISGFVNSTSSVKVATPTRDIGTTSTSYWKGCIEERQTVNTITSSSGYTIPTSAYDLNIDMIPSGDKATKWKPFWPEVSYSRGNSTSATSGTSVFGRGEAYVACPTEAKRLTAWTRADLNTYLNSLAAIGGTYHDIGMIWGARMLSRNGIFKADNPVNYNSMPVSRFLIFLTDGAMAPNPDTYTAYGVEQNDQRVTGVYSVPNQKDRHMQRFKMICNAVKAQNISIWVIAFDATLDSSLTECASSSSQASLSSNQAQLIAKFVEIGKNIGSLRLSQ